MPVVPSYVAIRSTFSSESSSCLVVQQVVADSILSDKNPAARRKALKAFSEGRIPVMVATDVMACGIDVENITHVINYEMPNGSENYVHRIGRTARRRKNSNRHMWDYSPVQ